MTTWNDQGLGEFELRYLRNRLGQEADFLILRAQKPWLLGDVKMSQDTIDPHIEKMAHALGDVIVLQIVSRTGVLKTAGANAVIVSADRWFALLP